MSLRLSRLAAAAAPLLLIALLIPIPQPGEHGAFNTFSGLAYCTTRSACLHEIGHALDRSAGWISQSPEFYRTVQMYLLVELRQEQLQKLPVDILEITYRDPDGAEPVKRELYAFVFQQSGCDPERVPESLRSFYNWGLARQLLAEIQDGQRIYFFSHRG